MKRRPEARETEPLLEAKERREGLPVTAQMSLLPEKTLTPDMRAELINNMSEGVTAVVDCPTDAVTAVVSSVMEKGKLTHEQDRLLREAVKEYVGRVSQILQSE